MALLPSDSNKKQKASVYEEDILDGSFFKKIIIDAFYMKNR
jgi:hypothetical protein